ncbi:MAG: pyruvate formate lyase-activating protein [Bacteroidaceae bacterium]|nr:pyruvate formate lyase-activating protein [Bacteroidaceae bacterium]
MKGRINQLESFGTVDGPGIRFVVFFQGCPLRCQFCHNPDTWEPTLDGFDNKGKGAGEFTPEQLMAEVLQYKNYIRTGGVTASGGEPLMQPEFLRAFFKLCKEEGIHTCLDTSGAIYNQKALDVLEFTDLVMLDIKTLDDTLHESYTGATRKNNHQWMEHLQEIKKPTWIRHVVVPTITDREERLLAIADYIARYSCVERLELLGYHIMGKAKYRKMGIPYPLEGIPPLSPEKLNEIREFFRKRLKIKVM